MAHASSGVEVEAAHWNRMAFLVSLLTTTFHFYVNLYRLASLPYPIHDWHW